MYFFTLYVFMCKDYRWGEKIAVLLNMVQPSKRLLRLHAILYKSSQINKYETTEKYLDSLISDHSGW